MKNVPSPDAKTPRPPRPSTTTGKTGATPRPRNAGDDYDQFVNAALRASRQDEARAQRRREQRRKQNIIWISGFAIVVLALILLVWAMAGRRAQNPSTDLAATENATESVVEATPTLPAGNAVEAVNSVEAGNTVDDGSVVAAGTIPVEITVVSSSTSDKEFISLRSSDNAYKIVGKSELGETTPQDSGELFLSLPLGDSTLEVCPGESCTDQPLADENATPYQASLKVAADVPYTLCARDTSGAARQMTRFRVLVKVNRAPQTP